MDKVNSFMPGQATLGGGLHSFQCSCFECTATPQDRILLNHVESNTSPGYYIGSTLIAKKYVTSYTLPKSQPNGNPLGSVKDKYSPSDTVGKVLSYVVDPITKLVWWELDNKKGWVQHFPGYFDKAVAGETSSGKAFNDEMSKTNEINLNPLPLLKQVGTDLFNITYLKWILLALLIVLLIALFFRIKGNG